MRLIHTADWHLGDRLGRIDRSPELRSAVERIAAYCDERAVDVLLIAGDIFSELPRADGLRECVRHFQATFEPFFRRGGTIVAVTGNHDHEGFCRTLRHAMGLAAPTVESFGALVPPGRFYLADEPTLLKLPDASGQQVQFVLMPFPQPAAYLVHEAQQRYASLSEKKQFLQAAFTQKLADVLANPCFDKSLPAVLVAHVNVAGAEADYLFRMAADDDIVCPGEMVGEFVYGALGHIHKPHHLPGQPHVRYSGSIARLDLGEQADRKGVNFFEIADGKLSPIEQLQIDAQPIYTVLVADPQEDLPALADRHPDRDRALVNLDLRYTAGDDLESLLAQLDAIFPHWYARSWTENSELRPSHTSGPEPSRGFDETVRGYVGGELDHHPEEVRAAVLERLDALLAAEAEGVA